MKRFALICCLTLLAASLAFAQEKANEGAKPEAKPAAAALLTVDQILDKYAEAIGGKAAHEKLSSRMSKGTFEMPAMGISGTFVGYEKAPNKMARIIEIGGFGTVDMGFDGKAGWQRDPMQGLRDQTGAELAMAKIEAEFYGAFKMKELFKKLEVKGKEQVGGADAYVVEATPAEGSPVKMYFDAKTGLLVRQDAEAETPQGKMPSETYLEDYRAVDGVKMPFVVKLKTPAMEWTIKLEEIKHNVPVDETKFNKPTGQ
jgi:hypothetical protein